MNNLEFVSKLKNIYLNYPNAYAKGCFGQMATDSFINQKKSQYPTYYTASRTTHLKALDDNTRLFDCVGLIKAVLWGFPKISYCSNKVPDLSDQGIYDACINKSKDFSNIQIGELVWIKGHVGVYIGDNKCIECTLSWEGKVIISSMVTDANYHKRTWTAHGRLPYIEYIDESFKVQVEHDYLEGHKDYNVTKVYKNRPVLTIVDTKDNFGKTSEGTWVDLTKCRRC